MAKGDSNVASIPGELTEARVQELITAALTGLVTPEQLQTGIAEATKGLITEEQARELIAQAQQDMFEHVNAATLESISAGGEPTLEPLDPDWLEGLEFRSSKQERKMVNGRPQLTGKPSIRPLTPGDVLSYRVTGDQVVIVAADGRKHTVEI